MPKLKTKSGVAKRFKITARGKVMKEKPGARHLLSHKSNEKMLGSKRQSVLFSTDAKRIKKLFA